MENGFSGIWKRISPRRTVGKDAQVYSHFSKIITITLEHY